MEKIYSEESAVTNKQNSMEGEPVNYVTGNYLKIEKPELYKPFISNGKNPHSKLVMIDKNNYVICRSAEGILLIRSNSQIEKIHPENENIPDVACSKNFIYCCFANSKSIGRICLKDTSKHDILVKDFQHSHGMTLSNKEDEYLLLAEKRLSLYILDLKDTKKFKIVDLNEEEDEIVDFFIIPKKDRILFSTKNFSIRLIQLDLEKKEGKLLHKFTLDDIKLYDMKLCLKSNLIALIANNEQKSETELQFFKLRGRRLKFVSKFNLRNIFKFHRINIDIGFSETSYVSKNHMFYTFAKWQNNPPFYTYLIDYKSMKILGKKVKRYEESLVNISNFQFFGDKLVCLSFDLKQVVINYLKWPGLNE